MEGSDFVESLDVWADSGEESASTNGASLESIHEDLVIRAVGLEACGV